MAFTYLKQTWFFFRMNLTAIMKIQLPFIIILNIIGTIVLSSLDGEQQGIDPSVMMLSLVSLLFLPLYWGATIAYLDSVVQDRPLTAFQALQLSLSRWGSLFLTYFISGAGIVLGLMMFIIPGLYLTVRWSFADYHCMLEKSSPLEAMKDSWETTREYFWDLLTGLACLFVLITGANLTVSWLFSTIGIDSLVVRSLQDIFFGFLNCLFMIYGFRVFCVMREKQS